MIDFNTENDLIRSEDSTSPNPVLTDSLELFKQELDILFTTNKYEVFGQPQFGNSIEKLLWKTKYSASSIESEINKSISDYCLMNEFFQWKVSFKIIRGAVDDIGILEVRITTDEGTQETVNFIFR